MMPHAADEMSLTHLKKFNTDECRTTADCQPVAISYNKGWIFLPSESLILSRQQHSQSCRHIPVVRLDDDYN